MKNTRRHPSAFIAICGLLSISASANAALFILDNTNNYSAEVAPGLIVSQPSYPSNGYVIFTGAIATDGPSALADFSTSTYRMIGGNENGRGPKNYVIGSGRPFTLKADDGQLYDALLTFYQGPPDGPNQNQRRVGTPPAIDNDAGLVINVTAAIPEPSSILLISLASCGLLGRRLR